MIKVVDQDSATLQFPHEEDIALDLDHRALIRYPGFDNANCEMVVGVIRLKIRIALASEHERISNKSLREVYRQV
jgi:hypothetical protein